VIEGTGEMCLGTERQILTSGQAAYIPSGVFHQMSNLGATPLKMIYCYGPAVTWHTGSRNLPEPCQAGVDAPPLPAGAHPQCTEKPK